MSTPTSRIEDALSHPRAFGSLLSAADQAGLAERVEEALQGGRLELRALAEQLEALLLSQAARLPSEVTDQLTLDQPTDMRLAYEAGLLGFAQLLTAQAAGRRAPDKVQDLVRSAPLLPYLIELSKGERSNSQLVDAIGEAPETVSRKLKRLRSHGVACYRRDGRIAANYLTPLGKALAGASYSDAAVLDSPDKVDVSEESALTRHVLLMQLKAPLAEHLREQPVLGVASASNEDEKIAYAR